MKTIIGIIIIALLILGLVTAWVTIDATITKARAKSLALTTELEQLRLEHTALVNAHDVTLADNQKLRQAGEQEGEQQFYRGVYAACLTMGTGIGMFPDRDTAIKTCQGFTKAGMEQDAHGLQWEGIDTVPQPKPGQQNG